MTSFFVLLGLAGFAALIGGFTSFLSLFSSGDKENHIRRIEDEVRQLRLQLDQLKHHLAAPIPIDRPLAVVTTSALDTPNTNISIEPNIDDQFDITIGKTYDTPTVKKPAISPATPNFIQKGIAAAKNWLFGGNTLVRSGIVILFIGIAFLLKYTAEHTRVPIELRLTGVALAGIALLVVGWRLRDQRAEYSWALQGGGVGILYLTTFAALKLYQVIPTGAAFALLIAIAFLSALIAVLQFSLPLAMLGFTGGFLAPILTSTGHGSHVSLFSYYLVLNLAIAFITYFSAFIAWKNWRPLNLLGFAFTFVIGTLWGAENYQPELFSSTEPFLIIHFLLFTAIAVLYAHSQASINSKDYVDATLVFGTPLIGFTLQYALLRDSHFGLAYSALALGIFYLALAWWILTYKHGTLKFLGECFLALGIGFATLTLPLALDGRWTSAAWAVEGVGLLWVGLRQQRPFPTRLGLALQLLGATAFAQGWGLTGHSGATNQNMFLGVGLIALSGWACGAFWNAYRPNKFPILTIVLALWGWLWWAASGLTAIDDFLPSSLFTHAGLAFIAISSLLLPYFARKLKWERLAELSALLLAVMFVAMLVDAIDNIHPFAHYGMASWLVAFAGYIWLLVRKHIPSGVMLRAPLLWLAAIIGMIELRYQLAYYINESYVWKEIGWVIVPILLVLGIIRWQFPKKNTLSAEQLISAHTWAWVGCAPLVAFLVAWFMWMSLNSNGNAAPLPYVPFINPLDITLAAVLLLLFIWQRAVSKDLGKLQGVMPALAGAMGFTLLNGMLLRTLHHWVDTPFEWASLFNNSIVQMSFTFLWGITAFILMLLAHRQVQRRLWIVGASLMGLVVVKIFLLDLAQTGSVERIVSFIGAGLILLVMGYFAPLPPVEQEAQSATLVKEGP